MASKSLSKKTYAQTYRKESRLLGWHQGTYLDVVADPDDVIRHMPSACDGCPHYKMCKGTACISEIRNVIDAVVSMNVTEHQRLEILVCMFYGDTRKDTFPTDVKAVQYGENLQALLKIIPDRNGHLHL